MSKWDELSMAEKAKMMKVAVRQGITNLSDIRQRYNEFAEGGSKEGEEEVNTIVPFTQRGEVIITPDFEYNQYLNTLPDNQRFTPNDKYDSYFYWKLNGRPRNFEEAYNKGMFHYDHSDNAYHANSIAFDDNTGVGYFMKPKTHNTVGYELDWFNKGLVTEEGGKQRPVTPEEAVELEGFRKNYFLTNDPDRPNYYRYQPIEKAEGGGIHIKPSHRGRLTELKKRTGKTEAELYNDGNPAHKKMVVFARNSRKWKHGLGGNLFLTGGPEKKGREEVTNLNPWDELAAQSPFLYTIGKALDPTGISGYGDAREAINQYDSSPSLSNGYTAVMETLGALPIVSKVGKAIKFLQGAITGQGIFDDYNHAQEKMKEYGNELVVDYWDNTVKPRWKAERHGEQMKSKMSYTDVHHVPSFKLSPKGSKPGQVISNYTINHRVVNKYKKALGGNLFDGTTEDSQQMQVIRPDATYVAKPVIPPALSSITLPVESTSSIVTSNPGYYFIRDIVGKTLGLSPATYNAQDLTEEQLAEIDKQVRYRAEQKGITDAYFRFHPNDTIQMGIDAKTLYPEMYGRSYGNTDMQVKFRTPSGQIETTLGDYPVKIFKNGYEINDVYDFNTGQGLYPRNESLYARIRRWAGEHSSKNTDSDKSKLKFNIKRNLTHW